jgi:plastocyanin
MFEYHLQPESPMRLRYGLFVAFTVACGSSTSYSSNPPPAPPPAPPPPPPAGSMTVTITEYRFAPDTVTIKVGASVQWANQGTVTHSVTADSGAFDSGSLSGSMPDGYGGMTSGQTYTRTFTTARSFPYHCSIHPTQMQGVVIVTN